METGYSFNNSDLPLITVQLLTQILSCHIATTAVLVEHMNISDEEKNEILKEITLNTALEKEQLLKLLYVQFGSTPDL